METLPVRLECQFETKMGPTHTQCFETLLLRATPLQTFESLSPSFASEIRPPSLDFFVGEGIFFFPPSFFFLAQICVAAFFHRDEVPLITSAKSESPAPAPHIELSYLFLTLFQPLRSLSHTPAFSTRSNLEGSAWETSSFVIFILIAGNVPNEWLSHFP